MARYPLRSFFLAFLLSAIVLLANGAVIAAYRPGEVLVRYKPGASAQARIKTSAAAGTKIKDLDTLRTHLIKLPPGQSVEDAVNRLKRDPNVEYAGPNHTVYICLEPDDEWYRDSFLEYYWQWGLYSDLYPDAGIDAPDAWDITTGASNIIIAVVDTGCDLQHEDLYAKIVQGRNVITGALNPSNPQDDHGHGTFTAGVAAAMTNNTVGVAGVSWNAKIMPIKALDSIGYGTEADAAAGIIWAADHGAKIINMSFGGYDDMPVEQQAVEYAWNKGCVLTGASGNDGSSQAFFPASYEQVIAVGASNEAGVRCSAADWGEGGSNYGDYLDVMAPGNGIMSTYWDTSGGTYEFASGTSAASPFVAGIAALLWSVNPSWSNLEVVNQIKTTCKNVGEPGWDEETGFGIVSAYYALTNPPLQAVTLGQLNTINDGSFVKIGSAVITSGSTDLPDRMCVEHEGRASAIALPYNHVPAGLKEGDIVNVIGTLSVVNGERMIKGGSVLKTGSRTPLTPVWLANKWVGGGALGLKTGVDGGAGLNNLSMLVTVCGRVTAVGWTYFYVDDGSQNYDGSGLLGLKIASRSLVKPKRGDYVRITGIASCEQPVGAGVTIPVIRPRRQGDMSTLF